MARVRRSIQRRANNRKLLSTSQLLINPPMHAAKITNPSNSRLLDRLDNIRLWIRYAGRRAPGCRVYQSSVRGKRGLEIGGPSKLFRSRLPLYQVIGNLDGVNFAETTVWEGAIQAGPHKYNYFRKLAGFQYITEATDLSSIASNAYDAVLSSHSLEHVANPIKALIEWRRVLNNEGVLILVLPNKDDCFDRYRQVTLFKHLLDDYNNGTAEDDLTHLEEVVAFRERQEISPETIRLENLDNFRTRTLHHHVFDIELMRQLLDHCNFKVEHSCVTKYNLIALGSKLGEN